MKSSKSKKCNEIDNDVIRESRIIGNNKLSTMNDAANLNARIEFYKQSDEIKKLELQFKMSENYKLELERDRTVKQLDHDVSMKQLERDITIKKLDLQFEREKNNLAIIEKNHDYLNNVVPKKK